MLSAYADIRYVAEALNIGATDGRQKPVLPRELPILLEKIIAEHRAGNARKGWPHALALGPAVPLQAGEVLFSRIDLTFLARPAGEESS